MKTKEFTKGNIIIVYKNKTWNDSSIAKQCQALYLFVLLELLITIAATPVLLVQGSNITKVAFCTMFFIFSVFVLLFTLLIGHSIIYKNCEGKARFLTWLQKLEDVRVQINDNKIFLLVKQDRVYLTYSIDTFLQPYTTKYKIVKKAGSKIKYIEFIINFNNPEETIVILY